MQGLEKILKHVRSGTLLSAIYRKILRAIKKQKNRQKLKEYKRIGATNPFIGVNVKGYTYIVSTSDYHGGFNLFNQYNVDFGQKIEDLYKWFKENTNYLSDRSKILVNVGANIGGAVIPSVKSGYFSSAIAFEPEPINFKLLKANLIMNDVSDKVKAHRIALSNENRLKEMYVSDHNMGAHAIFDQKIDEAELTQRDKSNKIKLSDKVECQTFDHFLKAQQISIDDIGFVFMDIEGHEGHFFEGAKLLLEKRIPVVTEFCPSFLKRSGGLEMFLDNVLAHYSKVVIGPFKKSSDMYEIVSIDAIKELKESEAIYDLLLIP